MARWGRPVRLAGGTLTHYAGADQRGSSHLAHDDWAWSDTLRDPLPGARECERCLRKIPGLAERLGEAEG